jgi:catechol 2,3-dioxygenase-like lactoylglutathione lyase family enzyme
MKTHLNLATEDLPKSVAFYSTLLDAPPAKLRSDYALFIAEQPPLELALDAVPHASLSGHDHFGIYVETNDDVERAIQRLADAGLASSVEREQTCCYAKQSKVWATDPTGRRWEIYTVHEETPERGTCCSDQSGADDAAST